MINKRFFTVFIMIMSLFLMAGPVFAAPVTNVDIYINDVKQTVPDSIKIFVDNQARTQVPLRFVAEKLGHEVKWDAKKQEVSIDGGSISLTINNPVIKTPNGSVTMDTVPFIKNVVHLYLSVSYLRHLDMKLNTNSFLESTVCLFTVARLKQHLQTQLHLQLQVVTCIVQKMLQLTNQFQALTQWLLNLINK